MTVTVWEVPWIPHPLAWFQLLYHGNREAVVTLVMRGESQYAGTDYE